MTEITVEQQLLSLQKQIDKLNIQSWLTQHLIWELLGSAIDEQKISADWLEERIADVRKTFDQVISNNQHFSDAYLSSKPSDLLTSLEEEISSLRDLITERSS